MKKVLLSLIVILSFLIGENIYAAEMPKPTYSNSFIFSMTHSFSSTGNGEMDYLTDQFGNGIYAPLCMTSFKGVAMEWHVNIAAADGNIASFKNTIDNWIQIARLRGVGIHVILTFGISRNIAYYGDARNEDIRNAMWYNDNNIVSQNQWLKYTPAEKTSGWPMTLNKIESASDAQAQGSATAVEKYAFSTMSRYARKLRNHLEAKVAAAMNYLDWVQQQNPDVLIIVSAPGEAELNLHPVNNNPPLAEYFCDYSPFAVMEFRDWVRHEGMYADNGKYAGQGYVNGGSRYRGSSGLANFNGDFGTSFSNWELKYYNWNLSDPVDTNYVDSSNPDTKTIPVQNYVFDGMMPTGGADYIPGGFDPPRVMKQKGQDAFYDLWHKFRETLVYHYVLDMASIARQSGFPRDQYYTHQIPGDYLFGTHPDAANLNPRYYSSASPLWTGDAYNDTGIGITCYDVSFGSWYARTSQYVIPAISAMTSNWGAVEYNPEVIPANLSIGENSTQSIYEQILRLYQYNAHVISFFKWLDDTGEHRFKGGNREAALKLFFDAVKDKARQSTGTVFTPKKVEGFYGTCNSGLIRLSWSRNIWPDLSHEWGNWGDFGEFVIYRGYSPDFTCNSSSEIGRTGGYSYSDGSFTAGGLVYYKIAAVNVNDQKGTTVTATVDPGGGGGTPELSLSSTYIIFGGNTDGKVTAPQTFRVSNTGNGVLNWTLTEDVEWFSVSPSSGINSGVVTVTVNPLGKEPGTYRGIISVSAPGADGSPRSITVQMNIYNAGTDAKPIGSFDTPFDGDTVRSSVPFTGWVLDDLGIDSVRIYRQEGGGLVPVGDAVLVEGARTDIESQYPTYPENHKAGWGYMMLTNFLPGGGNGNYTFHVIATDMAGNQTTLGVKTVTCDNEHAVKPFGAIESPDQGGSASGGSYTNWGWVLTPQPNYMPMDGSTIRVVVDGVDLGHPVYNLYRHDVASKFPGYANSNGAFGYFDFDTTALDNGVHTIQWVATDSAGNRDGIGSRYFTIQNTGSRLSVWAAPCGRPMAQDVHKSQIPVSGKIPSDKNGNMHIQMNISKPLVLPLGGPCTGYLRVGEDLRPLPIGSTLDRERGIFYWQPGPGFRGEFHLEFVVQEFPGQTKRKNVTVTIN